ncbi:hypothetical protein [Pelagibacterium sp. H642]|uniref:hypothetical protein n=1 Tax=Pelagibacterium sp. H642 TaxID=1881069 RepID=UPI002815A988|nr:hypothetical protein [Pelagibacterium sp. H642]WMT90096.1 hypothetical protein NO934_15055 [Pelagibacterium sp. H642]
MPVSQASQVIERTKERAHVLQEELLHWAAEVGRAEEAGAANETQVQAIQSAAELARHEADGLRAVLAANVEMTDEEAEAMVKLDRELTDIASEYAQLRGRAARLYRPKELAEPPLPTSFNPR